MKKTKVIALCLAVTCMISVLGGCSGTKKADNGKVTVTMWLKPAEDDLEWKIETNERMEKALLEKFPDINFEF